MKRLWASWRYVLFEKKSKKTCLFCEKIKSIKNKQKFILSRGVHSFVMLNIYPYNNGHIMVAPYRHVGDIALLKREEMIEIFEFVVKSIKILKKVYKPEGFNIGLNLGKAAGAGVEKHLHIHVVPRWKGDTNFMPVISNTKVISQALNKTYEILKKYYNPVVRCK